MQIKNDLWAASFITYNEESHLFSAWDETQAEVLGEFSSWDEAKSCIMEYSVLLDETDSRWIPINSKYFKIPDEYVLIKGPSGVHTTLEYIIKALYIEGVWYGIDNNKISNMFMEPTHWIKIPK